MLKNLIPHKVSFKKIKVSFMKNCLYSVAFKGDLAHLISKKYSNFSNTEY